MRVPETVPDNARDRPNSSDPGAHSRVQGDIPWNWTWLKISDPVSPNEQPIGHRKRGDVIRWDYGRNDRQLECVREIRPSIRPASENDQALFCSLRERRGVGLGGAFSSS